MAWNVARFRGIQVQVHWTLLLVLPLFAYLMAFRYFGDDGVTAISLAWGLALAVTLFLSVLVHEFSHSLMALRLGVPVRAILLMPLGGVSQMESTPERPGHEARITVVGPLTNYVLAGPLLLSAYLAPVAGNAGQFLLWAGWLNVVLGTFNLVLPAFPMDGGRLLRAVLAHRLGAMRATRIAANVGRGLAVFMGLAGFLAFGVGGIWLVLIAFFIYAGAGAEEAATTARHLLRDLRARDLMTPEPEGVSPSDSTETLLQALLRTRHLALPVMRDGKVVGCVDHQAAAGVAPEARATTRVRDIMSQDIGSVERDAPAADVLQAVERDAHRHVIVTDRDRPVGIISGTDVQRMVQVLRVRSP